MKLLAYLRCLHAGHVWRQSQHRPGWQTCARCLARRPDPWGGRKVPAET